MPYDLEIALITEPDQQTQKAPEIRGLSLSLSIITLTKT